MASATSTTPDLSLHISLPSGGAAGAAAGAAPPPGLGNGGAGTGRGGAKTAAGGGGDPWRRLDGSTASTELSLSTPQQQQEGTATDVLPWRLRQPTTAAAAPVPVTLPTLPMDGSAAAAARPIRGVPVYSSAGGGGGHPFLGGGGGGDHRHNRLYNPYHSTAWPSSSLCSTSPAPAPPPPPAALDPTSSLLSPSAYHRMLSSTGRLHGMLADKLRGYGAAARGGLHRIWLRGGSGSFASSRFMPHLLPASRRSIRAPWMQRMSSLHARFVHAVELLGDHHYAVMHCVCPEQSTHPLS